MKNPVDQLAICGGMHAFAEKLHVGRPNIGNRERLFERINDILDRRWLTNNGPFAQEFEQQLAEFLDVRHCIAMCNATVALEIVARALGLHGEVIVPSFTFVATPHSLQWQEITPVFCDINPATHNLDPAKIEHLITPHTTGILGVHIWGRACNIEALTDIATKHSLKLFFDAAHAFGCSYQGQMIGNFGDAEVFSFHATKFFNTFEGGVVATNNDELAEKIRLMRNFGFAGMDNVIYIGTNGKMTEISAAMGLTSLESLDEFIATNYRNYKVYREGLANIPGIELVKYNETEKNNYQYIVLQVDEKVIGISRDEILMILHAENVRARRYFYPGCHNMEPYSSMDYYSNLNLPETDTLTKEVLLLPTGTSISVEDIYRIHEIIKIVIDNSEEIKSLLLSR